MHKPTQSESPPPIRSVISALPELADHPRVQPLVKKHAELCADLASNRSLLSQLERNREVMVGTSYRQQFNFERHEAEQAARELAGLPSDNAARATEADLHAVTKRVKALGDARELVEREIRDAKVQAARELADEVRRVVKPVLRAAVNSYLAALAAFTDVNALRAALMVAGLSQSAADAPFPSNPFSPQLIGCGSTGLNNIGRLITNLESADLLDAQEASTYRGRFPGCG